MSQPQIKPLHHGGTEPRRKAKDSGIIANRWLSWLRPKPGVSIFPTQFLHPRVRTAGDHSSPPARSIRSGSFLCVTSCPLCGSLEPAEERKNADALSDRARKGKFFGG